VAGELDAIGEAPGLEHRAVFEISGRAISIDRVVVVDEIAQSVVNTEGVRTALGALPEGERRDTAVLLRGQEVLPGGSGAGRGRRVDQRSD
jgi:hypothetical protein